MKASKGSEDTDCIVSMSQESLFRNHYEEANEEANLKRRIQDTVVVILAGLGFMCAIARYAVQCEVVFPFFFIYNIFIKVFLY